MSDQMGQGHHKGESPFATLKRAFGWDHQPKIFKNPFFLGFLGSLLIGVTLLNDRVLPHAELSKREYESRMEAIQVEKDRRKLEELANSDRAAGEALKRVQASDPFATGSTRRD